MADKTDYYRRVFEASKEEVLGLLTPEDRAVIRIQAEKDIRLFLEDPNSRICFIRTK